MSNQTSYTDVLPSLHVTYRPTDNMVIRGAWTNTIGRPNFEDVAPRLEVDDEEGEAGNADLEPFESMGLDFSFEYYLEPSGIASIGERSSISAAIATDRDFEHFDKNVVDRHCHVNRFYSEIAVNCRWSPYAFSMT